MKYLLPAFSLLFCFVCVKAATVDTALTHSIIMNKDIKCVVIKPSSYDGKRNFPVVYLLHGYSDNYDGWVTKVPAIKQYADQDSIIIVCPDGHFNSWYMDAPMDSAVRYETYISKIYR